MLRTERDIREEMNCARSKARYEAMYQCLMILKYGTTEEQITQIISEESEKLKELKEKRVLTRFEKISKSQTTRHIKWLKWLIKSPKKVYSTRAMLRRQIERLEERKVL